MKTDRGAVAHWYQAGLATGLLCGALAAILIIMAETFPAKAEGKSWTGCYVGAHVGYGIGDLQISGTELNDPTPISGSLEGLSSRGYLGGGNLGCDYQMQRVVIGGFADYSFQDVEFVAGINFGGFGGAGVTLAIEDQWSVGGRLGVLANDSTLLYGLVAYTQAKTSGDFTIGVDSISLDTPNLSGWSVGAGIETRLTDNLFLKGEYRYSMFDTESYEIFGGDGRIDFDQDLYSVRVGLAWKFGASSEPLSMK